MKFNQELIFTGKEDKKSQKTGRDYTIIKLLDEEGNQISCIAESIEKNIIMLQKVHVAFELRVGKYIQLKALEVRSID